MSWGASLSATERDLLVVGSGGPVGAPLSGMFGDSRLRVREVAGLAEARLAVADRRPDVVVLVPARGDDAAEAAAFIGEIPDAARIVWAPRQYLAAAVGVFAGAADEVVSAELAPDEAALRVGWAMARHDARREEQARSRAEAAVRVACAALPAGADTLAVLARGADALLTLPGVRGVRVERFPLCEGPVSAGDDAEPPAEVRARAGADGAVVEVSEGERRLLVTPLGVGRSAVLTLRLDAGARSGALVAAARELGRALDAAVVLEAELERALGLQRGCVARQRDVARLEARLERVAATRDALAGFLSHDLRSPLTVLVGHCQMLAEGAIPPARRAASLDTIRRQAEMLGQTAAGLLERHRAGREEVGPSAVFDLAALAHDAVVRAQPTATLRKQALRLGSARGALIDADAAGVGDMVDALLDCAIRRAPEGGGVRVGVSVAEDRVLLSVRGDGATWPPSPVQADATPEGRGLAGIAAHARARGGDLSIVPVPGAAGELVLALPRAATPTPWPVFVLAAHDDDVDALLGLLAPLRGSAGGHRFGAAASEALRRATPNVVVVDARRDPAAALATLDALRGDPACAGVPIVVLAPQGATAASARHAGAFAVVDAPSDGPRLLAAVLHARRAASAAESALVARPLDALTGLDTAATLALRLAPLQAAARAVGAPLPAVVVTGIAPRLDEPGRTRAVSEQLVVWMAAELRARALPGELIARVDADALTLVSPFRAPSALTEIRDELRTQLSRARPRVGVTRVAVRGEVEVADLTRLGEDAFKMMTVGMWTAAEVGHAS